MLLEKRLIGHFCGISLQFRPKLFQMARRPFLEFTKKFFPATQNLEAGQRVRQDSLAAEKRLILSIISFDLVDPNTGEGGSAEALVDPKLLEDLNSYNLGTNKGQAFLIWIDTNSNEVRWQLRKTVKSETPGFNPA